MPLTFDTPQSHSAPLAIVSSMSLPFSRRALFPPTALYEMPVRLLTDFHYSRTDQDYCYPKVIGYKPATIMEQIDHTTFSTSGRDSADELTNAFILHPVACALAFIAGLVALGGMIGGLISTMIAIVAWLITLVVMAIDFAAFGVSLVAILKFHMRNL